MRMAQRMSSLESISTHASAMPTNIGPDSAFLASGRFMVTTAVDPTRSKVRCSVPVTCAPFLSGRTLAIRLPGRASAPQIDVEEPAQGGDPAK